MRPINLIPKEERGLRGGVARTGPFVYTLVGALAVVLIGVVMLVLISNKVSDREGEIAKLEAQKAKVSEKSSRLAAYVNFEKLAEQRIETITALADDRFDWVRIIRELSLVLPPGTTISNLTAASAGGSAGGAFAAQSPAVTITGCTTGQDGTAAVITAMKQIDGVTRVGLSQSSDSGEGEEGGGGEAACSEASTSFALTATFDEAPQAGVVEGEPAVVESAPPEAEGESSEAASGSEEGGSGETADSSTEETEGAG